MRGMVMAFFGLCMAGTAQASSLVYFSDTEPASTPSVVAPAAAGHDVDPSVQSAVGQIWGASVVLAGEAEMPVTQEKVSAIPDRSGPARATMVIRDGVVGAALPRHMAKPAAANGKQPATEVSAKAGKDGPAEESIPDAAR
ncbi:hypothetical protein ACFWXH_02055 [Mesorhizobium sp. NPDC059054]|uniref:hypothetical protein n=1 Tax=Mesorhizobium sp. NPDC059054 TaxID=3346711 RepID=UPI00369240EC